MGSGARIQVLIGTRAIGFGLYVDNFPFAFTIGISILVVHIQIGLGKPYDA